MSESARLSKLLFDSRDVVEMYADVVQARMTGVDPENLRRLVADIDAYRAERGWSPNGFGGEQDDPRA